MSNIKEKTISGFIWRIIQNSSAQIINFVISLVLTRLLDPDDYGLAAMASIFNSIALVFVNTGFTSSIIQKDRLDDDDLCTMFWSGLILSVFIYLLLFIMAPRIATFYHHNELISMIRVESFIVPISALFSVQQAILSRNLQFKISFLASLIGAVVHGIVGISMALAGYGSWALIVSSLANNLVCVFVLWSMVKWRPSFRFSKRSFTEMFGFNVKMLTSSLLDTVYNNIQSLIIGRQYTAADLAYYNRGNNIPSIFMTVVDGSMTSVLFPTLSKYQNDWENGLKALRRSLKLSMYVCLPLLFGLIAVSRSMVIVLFTEKWLESVDYIRLSCLICAFWPLSAKSHALNSLGKSEITVRIKTISNIITLTALLLTYRISAKMILVGMIFASLFVSAISALVYSKHLNYTIKDQIFDVLQSLLLSAIMAFTVYGIELLSFEPFLALVIQIALGIIVYVLLSFITRNDSFNYLLRIIKEAIVKISRSRKKE